MQKTNILVYGYGNPGRQDDGLGPEIISLLEDWIRENNIDYVFTDSNYQLNIEDASTIHDFDVVIFVDATVEEIRDFSMIRVVPSDKVNFTMHAMDPSFVVDLCRKLYDKAPESFLLKIRGYDYELKEGMSKKAEDNLLKAFSHLKKILKHPDRIPVLNGSEVAE